MKSKTQILKTLNQILTEKEPIRKELIKSLQTEIWNDQSFSDGVLNDILSELAYDLDFYEPNENWRNEDSSYYGDECLEKLVKQAFQKLEAI